MATPRKGAPADDLDAFQNGATADVATDCAACHAPLPEGYRYVCAACATDSAARAQVILAGLQAHNSAATPAIGASLDGDLDEVMECPSCGMALDASGRCAGCVTTVRR